MDTEELVNMQTVTSKKCKYITKLSKHRSSVIRWLNYVFNFGYLQ